MAAETKHAGSSGVPITAKSPGKLTLTIHSGRNLYDAQLLGKQDPYACLSIGTAMVRTKVHNSGGLNPTWQQSFDFKIKGPGETLTIEVFDKETLKDNFIGRGFLDIDEMVATEDPHWYRIGRGQRNNKPAGEVMITCKYFPDHPISMESLAKTEPIATTPTAQPQPAPQPIVYMPPPPPPVMQILAPAGFNPAMMAPIDMAASTPLNLTGTWRVYVRDTRQKERSYELQLYHAPNNMLSGSGVAAHMSFTVKGSVEGGNIVYKEIWGGMGSEQVRAVLKENGTTFDWTDETGVYSSARKVEDNTRQQYPQYFFPYYNVTGDWRVYVEQGGTKKSYSLNLVQNADGTLGGGGQANNLRYTVQGRIDKNVLQYTETWQPQGGKDHIFAELSFEGDYFKCRTDNAELQAAKRVDSLTDGERIMYFLPYR